MAEDTAVTEVPVEEAVVQETAPEPVQEEPQAEQALEAPETSDEPVSETTEPVAPETETPTLSDDDFRADSRFKEFSDAEITARVASETESIRRMQEATTRRQVADQNQAQAQQFMQEGLSSGISTLIAKVAATDNQQLLAEHMQELNALVAGAANAATVASGTAALRTAVEVYNDAKEVEGWQGSADDLATYSTALGAQDVDKASGALMKIHGSREFARGLAAGVRQETVDAKKRTIAAEKVETENQAAEKRKGEATPTDGSGKPASERNDLDIIGNPDYSAGDQAAAYERHFKVPYQR